MIDRISQIIVQASDTPRLSQAYIPARKRTEIMYLATDISSLDHREPVWSFLLVFQLAGSFFPSWMFPRVCVY
jgi:hypothetical protein